MIFNTKVNRENGGAAVEFAFCIPLLLMILTLIIDYGWYFTNELIVINAVSTGARQAVKAGQGEDEATIKNIAIDNTKKAFWPDTDGLTVTATLDPVGTTDNAEKIIVSASANYKSITGFVPTDLIPSSIAAKAVMIFP